MGMAQFHVLAVDDSLIDRKLIERLLKTSSCQVTTVDSGSKALEFLGVHESSPCVSPNNHQEVQVNLVITDYCMPGMTGYDLLKKIKVCSEYLILLETSSLRDIPVVIVSSENVPSRINRCLEEGAEEFFLKPVQLSDLKNLKPHIMKTKIKDQNKQKQQEEESSDKSDFESPSQSSYQPQRQQQPQQQSNHNNKRKAPEKGLSPERTRPIYNGIATVV